MGFPPMKRPVYVKFRRKTPWTDLCEKTPMQEFLDNRNPIEYEARHTALMLSRKREAELLNTYEPESCKYFSITTNTISDNHKIPISGWMEFILGVSRYQSFSSISKSMRIADMTTRYWMSKLFLLLKDFQTGTMLS
jgi:hypothetical protein